MEQILASGTLIRDRYRIERLAWPSAIGPVWQARDLVLDRNVLVFTLSTTLASDANAREALAASAARSAQAVDPHLAQVYDANADPPYLIAEMPGGARLAERLADRPMALDDAARALTGVAAALRALHEQGIAHGSVGPAWVGLDEEGRGKLMGAGLSDVADVAIARGIALDPPMQPPGYPDRGTEDAWITDVRALGALAFHVLSGQPPGPGRSLAKAKIPPQIGSAIENAMQGHASLGALIKTFAPHATPVVPEAREPGFLRTEGKWLIGSALLIVAAVIAILTGLGFNPLNRTPAPKVSPSSAQAAAIKVSAVRDFDPQGDGTEHPNQTSLAIDGDATSSWFTVNYASPEFGGGKKGVGLLFDLGSAQRVMSVRLRSPLPSWQGEWRAADSPGTTADAFRAVATFTASSDGTSTFSSAPPARYWLLWITRLTDCTCGGPLHFQAAVADVEFFGGSAS